MSWEEYADSSGPHFVWVRGPKGPSPQKWKELYFGLGNWKKPYVLAYHRLTEADAGRSLDELAALYPAPRVKD